MFSQGRQHTGEYLQAQIFFVAQPVGTSLKDPDLVVQALDETKSDLVHWLTVGGNAIPMSVDHLSKLLVRFQPLLLQARPPILEEPPRPASRS